MWTGQALPSSNDNLPATPASGRNTIPPFPLPQGEGLGGKGDRVRTETCCPTGRRAAGTPGAS